MSASRERSLSGSRASCVPLAGCRVKPVWESIGFGAFDALPTPPRLAARRASCEARHRIRSTCGAELGDAAGRARSRSRGREATSSDGHSAIGLWRMSLCNGEPIVGPRLRITAAGAKLLVSKLMEDTKLGPNSFGSVTGAATFTCGVSSFRCRAGKLFEECNDFSNVWERGHTLASSVYRTVVASDLELRGKRPSWDGVVDLHFHGTELNAGEAVIGELRTNRPHAEAGVRLKLDQTRSGDDGEPMFQVKREVRSEAVDDDECVREFGIAKRELRTKNACHVVYPAPNVASWNSHEHVKRELEVKSEVKVRPALPCRRSTNF